MIRMVLRADGTAGKQEVGKGFESWNNAISADIGQIVRGKITNMEKGSVETVELWCDEEATLRSDPVVNVFASILAGQSIFGDVIIFYPGDIT